MKLARTIGKVTLARMHPGLQGSTLRCVEVVESIDGVEAIPVGGETVIAWDICGAGVGDLVALAEGPEAAQPFRPQIKPIDASIVALIDQVDLK